MLQILSKNIRKVCLVHFMLVKNNLFFFYFPILVQIFYFNSNNVKILLLIFYFFSMLYLNMVYSLIYSKIFSYQLDTRDLYTKIELTVWFMFSF